MAGAELLQLPRLPSLVRRGDVPSHLQIEHWLLDAIDAGELAAGDRLPCERDLAAMLRVSRMTLRQALGALEARGLVTRVVGRNGGTFVQEPPISCDLTTLAGLTEQLRRHGVEASAKVLRAIEVPADERVASALAIDTGAPVFEVARLRKANGQPIVLERSCFPASLFPGMLDECLDGSLYALLEMRYGRRPVTACESLEAINVESCEAELLGIAPGTAIMLVERTAYAEGPTPVEHARDLFRSDRARIVFSSGIRGTSP